MKCFSGSLVDDAAVEEHAACVEDNEEACEDEVDNGDVDEGGCDRACGDGYDPDGFGFAFGGEDATPNEEPEIDGELIASDDDAKAQEADDKAQHAKAPQRIVRLEDGDAVDALEGDIFAGFELSANKVGFSFARGCGEVEEIEEIAFWCCLLCCVLFYWFWCWRLVASAVWENGVSELGGF